MTPRRVDLAAAFVKKAICQILAAKSNADPEQVARNRYGSTLEWNRRAGVSSMVSGSFTSEQSAFFDSVVELSLIGRMPVRKVPFGARVIGFSADGGATAGWIEQGRSKPISKMSFSASPIEPRKVAAISVFPTN